MIIIEQNLKVKHIYKRSVPE